MRSNRIHSLFGVGLKRLYAKGRNSIFVAVLLTLSCIGEHHSGRRVVSFTRLQITDTMTGAPLSRAEVTVSRIRTGALSTSCNEEPLPVSPTDDEGRVTVPINLFFLDASPRTFDGSLRVTIGSSTVEVENRAGATASANGVSIDVIDVQAAAPPPPVLRIVEGSNPPMIEVHGYVDRIDVCSRETRQLTWSVYINGCLAYVESVTIGTVPAGFGLLNLTYPVECTTSGGTGDIVSVSTEGRVGDRPQITYCLDEAGTVTSCPQ